MTKGAAAVSGTKLLQKIAENQAIHYKTDDLSYDLGTLSALDNHPVDPAALRKDTEGALLKVALENTQLLVKQIFELPIDVVDIGPVATLPARTTKLPRGKPIPQPKPLTRWEKFALEKGIQKKKRGRMTWDEEKGDWAPRWGYKRADDGTQKWAIAAKPGDADDHDPFEHAELQKKQRVVKNKLNQIKNIQYHSKTSGLASDDIPITAPTNKAKKLVLESTKSIGNSGGALVAPRVGEKLVDVEAPKSKRPRTEDAADAGAGMSKKEMKRASKKEVTGLRHTASGEAVLVPAGIPHVSFGEGAVDPAAHTARVKPKEGKSLKAEKLKVVQTSTASMGKFDTAVRDEPARPKDPKKMKRLPNEVPVKSEADRYNDVLRKVLGGSGEGEKAAAGGVVTKSAKKSEGSPGKSHAGVKRKR